MLKHNATNMTGFLCICAAVCTWLFRRPAPLVVTRVHAPPATDCDSSVLLPQAGPRFSTRAAFFCRIASYILLFQAFSLPVNNSLLLPLMAVAARTSQHTQGTPASAQGSSVMLTYDLCGGLVLCKLCFLLSPHCPTHLHDQPKRSLPRHCLTGLCCAGPTWELMCPLTSAQLHLHTHFNTSLLALLLPSQQ